MLTFYPRDIGLWRETFDFNLPITLTPKDRYPLKQFYNREEFIEFLKEHRIRLDDPYNPLTFKDRELHSTFGYVSAVIQWSLIGWVKE